jgi:hypothetical protein
LIKWSNEENPLYLITPEEYNQLPDGTQLECIDGTFVIKGVDYIDQDTRFGYIAFGARSLLTHPMAEYFTKFKLQS